MKANPVCRACGIGLNDENRYPSHQRINNCICKKCGGKRWGQLPFNENKECSLFLGVHIAEQALSHVFKDVKRMPQGHPGYDFVCNHGKKIDVKSSCQRKDGRWQFTIRSNKIADFFLCLAFDNREDLNPLHAWLIPGVKVNHLKTIGISPPSIYKWGTYRLDTTKISDCCAAMK